MEYLLIHAPKPASKDKLLQALTGWDKEITPNAVEVYISRLRGISAFGFELEGCRREQDWLDGRHWDRHLYALFKSNWSAVRPLLHLVDRNRHPG